MKTKDILCKTMWAYYATDGYLQVRTIADTKKDSREMLNEYDSPTTYKDYESLGWECRKIVITVTTK